MRSRARNPSVGAVCKRRYQPSATLPFPTAFDNAAWTKNRCTVSADAVSPPTGADSIVEDATAGATHYVQQSCGTFSTSATAPGVYFNLATGAVGTVNGGAQYTVSNVSGGGYLLSVTAVFPNGAYAIYMANGNNSPVYNGDGTSNVVLFNAGVG